MKKELSGIAQELRHYVEELEEKLDELDDYKPCIHSCPFMTYHAVDCAYMISEKRCSDLRHSPRYPDAWCITQIQFAKDIVKHVKNMQI